MSTMNHLGPHGFVSHTQSHWHPTWLHKFRPQERKQLVNEDWKARMSVGGLLIGILLTGLTLMIATVWFVLAH